MNLASVQNDYVQVSVCSLYSSDCVCVHVTVAQRESRGAQMKLCSARSVSLDVRRIHSLQIYMYYGGVHWGLQTF